MSNSLEKQKAIIVIFGATGDLARRKLYPSIYRLVQNGEISDDFAVIGTARRPWTDETFREKVEESIRHTESSESGQDMADFLSHFYYHALDVNDDTSYQDLAALLTKLELQYDTEGNRIFYLAMAPEYFGVIANNIKAHGMKDSPGWSRLMIEKPFGHNLTSAKELNNEIRKAFDEEQIYRIDHYLGKEMVQNIEVIRFANGIFEHLWNNRFIDNIQVTSSEVLGIEDRIHYYEKSGAVRDMLQNHMLQMVALLAMEPPITLAPEEIRSEKIKAFRAFRKIASDEIDDYFVRGQYGNNGQGKLDSLGYREEDEMLTESNTETYVAGKIMIDNYRWAGVPFYVRTGKRMTQKTTKIVVEFKDIPMNLYYKDKGRKHPNLLVINISPNEGVALYLNAKKAGTGNEAEPINLSYNHDESDGLNTPEAYEKLLYDCMAGDTTNFAHWDEVSLTWDFVDVVLENWKSQEANFPNYPVGSMGPKAANDLLEKDQRHWWSIETGKYHE